LGFPSLSTFGAFSIILLHVSAYGIMFARLARLSFNDSYARFALVTAAGLTLLGFQMFFLGYIGQWNLKPFVLTTAICLGYVFSNLNKSVEFYRGAFTSISLSVASLSPFFKILLAVSVIMGLVVLVSGTRPPIIVDEIDYHWKAPMVWAETGHWVKLPYRYMNGPCLTELVYLVAALFSSNTAAHWVHFLFFLALVAALISITKSCGGSAIVVAAACFTTPVLVNQAAFALSDDAVAALLVTALMTAITLRNPGAKATFFRVVGTIGLLLAGATSIKSAFVVAVMPAILFAVYQTAKSEVPHKKLIVGMATIGLVCVGTFSIWLLHTHNLTGKFLDSNCVVIIPANQNLADHQEAVAKIPALTNILLLPVVPIITSIFGQQEPYGGRTGLVIVPCLLSFLLVWKYLTDEQKLICKVVATCAGSYFLLLGAFTVRTRYLNFFWGLALCLSSVAFVVTIRRFRHRWSNVATLAYCAAVFIGMVDTTHTLLLPPDVAIAGKRIIPSFRNLSL
jgi:hypothetical protein